MPETPNVSTATGCYICHPEDPNASEDGCAECEARWQAFILAGGDPGYGDVIP